MMLFMVIGAGSEVGAVQVKDGAFWTAKVQPVE